MAEVAKDFNRPRFRTCSMCSSEYGLWRLTGKYVCTKCFKSGTEKITL